MKRKSAILFVILAILACISTITLIYVFNSNEMKKTKNRETEQSSDTLEEGEQLNNTEPVTKVDIEVPVATTYLCEKIGLYSDFTLILNEDSTFSYYEGVASSYIGYGKWILTNNELTLYDEFSRYTPEIIKINFTLGEDHCLYYHHEEPYPFVFTEIEEGTKFTPVEILTKVQRADLDAQAKKMDDEFTKACEEPVEVKPRYSEILTWDFNARGTKQILSVDGTQRFIDPTAPIKIWLSSEDGKVLWEDELGYTSEDWNSYYLYHTEESDYLIQYYLEEDPVEIKNTFCMFTIDSDGTMKIVLQCFETQDEYKRIFRSTANPLLRESESIVSTLFSNRWSDTP